MAEPGALAQALAEATDFADAAMVLGQRRQRGAEAIDETGQAVGGPVLQHAQVEPNLQRRAVSPQVRAAQEGHALQANVVEAGH